MLETRESLVCSPVIFYIHSAETTDQALGIECSAVCAVCGHMTTRCAAQLELDANEMADAEPLPASRITYCVCYMVLYLRLSQLQTIVW